MQPMSDTPQSFPPGRKQPLAAIRATYHISIEELSKESGVQQIEIASCEEAACYFTTSLEKIITAINSIANLQLTIDDIYAEYIVPKDLC